MVKLLDSNKPYCKCKSTRIMERGQAKSIKTELTNRIKWVLKSLKASSLEYKLTKTRRKKSKSVNEITMSIDHWLITENDECNLISQRASNTASAQNKRMLSRNRWQPKFGWLEGWSEEQTRRTSGSSERSERVKESARVAPGRTESTCKRACLKRTRGAVLGDVRASATDDNSELTNEERGARDIATRELSILY